MKKILSLLLSIAMLAMMFTLAGCGEKADDTKLKFGMGVYSTMDKTAGADGETQGAGEATVNVAAVLMDEQGKILKCVIDATDNTVNFTSDGKAVKAAEFKTKYELGDNYGMKKYGQDVNGDGVVKEWYEQVEAFIGLVEGKTYEEVKGLVGSENKGNDDVINAGCTITIADFIYAIEKAVKNATDSGASKDDALNIGIVSTQAETKDASEEANGSTGFDVSIVASAVGKDGKVTATASDVVSAEFTFDTKGATSADKCSLVSKRDAGDKYGMASYGQDLNGDGTVKEWYAQADEFNKAVVGKTADEIAALALDTGYGVDELQTAGCTINVADMVKAAVKSAE